MKTIIAGSRTIVDYRLVLEAVGESGFRITEVVSGGAKGVDSLGERWASEHHIPVKKFPADWSNITVPGAVIKSGIYGKYNARAGHDRNLLMAQYGDALIAIWDGYSAGTSDMIKLAAEHNLIIYVKELNK